MPQDTDALGQFGEAWRDRAIAADKIIEAARLDSITSKGYPKAGCEQIHAALEVYDKLYPHGKALFEKKLQETPSCQT